MLDHSPVFGCVLIGGKSSRLGKPKHLLEHAAGQTWLEHTVELLQQIAEQVIIVGAGEVPHSLADHMRLADAPDAVGPLAGILAAMRWAPAVSWLVAACDLPELSVAALRWLLGTRAPGVWATLPGLPGQSGIEPVLAHYDFRARSLLEQIAEQGNFSLNQLSVFPEVISPTPPTDLVPAWKNVNTPDELRVYLDTNEPPS